MHSSMIDKLAGIMIAKAIPGASLLVLLVCSAGFSQTNRGRIMGNVRDQANMALSGATVVITDMQRGGDRTVSTDQTGGYVAPDLAPGIYKIRAEAEGFESVEHPNIELEVAKDVRIDFALRPGDVSLTATVTGRVPLVESTSDVLGGTLSNKTINDLPLNGRDFQNLVVLRPGVMRYPGGGIGSVSSNGVRPEDNNYIVDGVDNNDQYFGQSVINGVGVQGTPATILPIDAIQEFNVQENPPAEYGWKPGAIVNVGLKSGTNSLHGTTYYFARNAALDARNFFNTTPDPKKPLRLHQFGGTLGGPIIKDKLFFFAGYEGIRDLVGVTQVVPSPATVSLGGDPANSIPDAIAGVTAHGVTVSPLSLRIATLFPSNPGTNPQGPGSIATGFPNTNRGDNGLMKVDYRIGQNHALSSQYFIGDSLQTEQDQPVLSRQWESQASTRAQVIGANWLWTPNAYWVNEAKFGYNRLTQLLLTADSNVTPTTYGINTGVTNPLNFGMPQITVNGFTSTGGNSGWPQLLQPAQAFQFTDNISYALGKHAIRFGGELRRGSVDHLKNRLGKTRIRFGFQGVDAFLGATPLEDFIAGVPSDGRLFVGDSHRQVSFWSYAAFIQDDWRVSGRLSVNIGLRYELNTVLKEANNLLGNFDPNIGLAQVGQQIKSPYNGDHSNFAPRLGVAWDLTGQGKTVLRAGGSVIYEVPHFSAFIGQFNLNNDPGTIGINIVPTGAVGVAPGGGRITAGVQSVPGANLNWTVAGPVFAVSNVDCSPATGSPCDVFSVDRNLRTPYVISWNLNLQHAFSDNLSLQVGYVGNHGKKLYSITDINQVNPALDDGSEQTGRPFNSRFPFLGFINSLSNDYKSNYNGLQATLTQRPYHGVSFLLGYTYSHALDQASDNRAPQAMDSTHPGREYGSSDFDIRHRFTLALTYNIPGIRSWGQLAEGWALNSILTLQTGQPWNVVDTGNDFSRTGEGGDRWDFFGDPADFSASPSGGIPFFPGTSNPDCAAHATTPGSLQALQSFGCFAKGNSVMIPPAVGTFGTMGRNIFRGPGIRTWDLSVVKNWRFSERLSAQLRAEFFNVLNHPNFANPYGVNATYFQVDPSAPGSFGCACTSPDVAAGNPVIGTGGPRNIQFGLKFIF
jgi:hypothetical protein